MLEADGWYEVNVVGSHHQFKHPTKKWRVTLKHPDKDILGRRLIVLKKTVRAAIPVAPDTPSEIIGGIAMKK